MLLVNQRARNPAACLHTSGSEERRIGDAHPRSECLCQNTREILTAMKCHMQVHLRYLLKTRCSETITRDLTDDREIVLFLEIHANPQVSTKTAIAKTETC